MAELTPEIADAVAAACRAGADEAAEALGRALDIPVKLAVGDPQTLSAAELPDDLAAPGLAVVLGAGPAAALLLVPKGTGLVPDWAPNPDPTGRSKLTTLAQELGMLLLPEDFLAEQFDALYLDNLAEGVQRAAPSASLAVVPLELTKEDGSQAEVRLLWPVSQAGALGQGAEEPQAASPQAEQESSETDAPAAQQSPVQGQPSTGPAPRKTAATPDASPAPLAVGNADASGPVREVKSPEDLPTYARSLLHIKVPVMVTLADKRQSLSRILELGPGAIIQFDKSCEDPLCLEVGGQPVAQGEAVKVGEKFGLRITAMILPGERFQPQGGPKKAENPPG